MLHDLRKRWLRWFTNGSRRRSRRLPTQPLLLECLEKRQLLSAYVVTSVADSGAGTIRAAILAVNAGSDNEIDFHVSGSGLKTFRLASPLPTLTANNVFINGLSQGSGSKPLIELNGAKAGSANGLVVGGANDTISGLAVEGFALNGIDVTGNDNRIGTAGAGNVVSNNGKDGILFDVSASGNVAQGNYVGINPTGTYWLANGTNGIEVKGAQNTLGGTSAGTGNVVSGNGMDGVLLEGNGNQLWGNYVGTSAAGTFALANGGNGVEISGNGNVVGGDASGDANVVSGNRGDGVLIDASADGNRMEGNLIGLNVHGNALGNSLGVEIAGTNNTLGGSAAGAGNVISANRQDGMLLDNTSSLGNVVEGNYVGTNTMGTFALPNGANGIEISGLDNTVGGAGVGNVVSGNSLDGVVIDANATGNRMQGDFVGTNASGFSALGNGSNGIEVAGADNAIGGTSAGAGNVISGNLADGILLDIGTNGTQIQGNYVGTNAIGNYSPEGYFALGNGTGIQVDGLDNTIGGTSAGAGNVLSGNYNNGLAIFTGATGNLVLGNRIGTSANGRNSVPNGNGVDVRGKFNTIGGTTAAARNVISGNNGSGIRLESSASANRIEGNYVGMNAQGSSFLGNGGDGVMILGANNTVGGTATGASNVIAGNNQNGNENVGGVHVSGGNGDTIRQNQIFANSSSPVGQGILLDSGANNNVSAPVLATASIQGSTLTITGTVSFPVANVPYVLEFFANPSNDPEGAIYVGSQTITPPGTGAATFRYTFTVPSTLQSDPLITATLTDPLGDTSVFSNGVVA